MKGGGGKVHGNEGGALGCQGVEAGKESLDDRMLGPVAELTEGEVERAGEFVG